MLKNSNVEVVYSIERYTPDAKNLFVDVEIATGSIVDSTFVSDNRGLIKHRITNIPDKTIQHSESLIVDSNGQVTLSFIPVDNNDIEVNEVPLPHGIGQLVDISGHSENDEVNITYYHIVVGRNWFNDIVAFKQADHPEYIGMNDYEYNSTRLWSILVEMGLMVGEVV